MIRRPHLAVAILCATAIGAQDSSAPASMEVTPRAHEAVDLGLCYLVGEQTASGAIGSKFPIAETALSGLALMASGVQYRRGRAHGVTGVPDDRSTYGEVLEKAVDFILRNVDGNGLIAVGGASQGRMHSHGYATLFLAEVYGTLPTRAEEERVGRALRRAVSLIETSQTGEGGWGYGWRVNDTAGGRDPDWGWDEGSVTVCMAQALRAARDAGIAVAPGVVERAHEYLRRSALDDGSFRYSLKMGENRSSYELTAAAVSTLNATGVYGGPEVDRGLAYMSGILGQARSPWRAATNFEWYGNLYAAQAFFQAGGDAWQGWYPRVRDFLIEEQRSDGRWDDEQRGHAYATASAILILQVPMRLLPIFQR